MTRWQHHCEPEVPSFPYWKGIYKAHSTHVLYPKYTFDVKIFLKANVSQSIGYYSWLNSEGKSALNLNLYQIHGQFRPMTPPCWCVLMWFIRGRGNRLQILLGEWGAQLHNRPPDTRPWVPVCIESQFEFQKSANFLFFWRPVDQTGCSIKPNWD